MLEYKEKEKEEIKVVVGNEEIGFFMETPIKIPDEIVASFNGVLFGGERIIAAAQGKTCQGNYLEKLIAVIWTLFFGYGTAYLWQYFPFCLLGIPFVVVGFIFLKTSGIVRQKIQIAVTDQRVLFRCGRKFGAVYPENIGTAKIFPSTDTGLFDLAFEGMKEDKKLGLVDEIVLNGICSMSAEDDKYIAAVINDRKEP